MPEFTLELELELQRDVRWFQESIAKSLILIMSGPKIGRHAQIKMMPPSAIPAVEVWNVI